MDEMTHRILGALTRNLGRPMSIQDLTASIRRHGETAYYANAYRAVQSLRAQELLNLERLGRTYAVSLNFGSYRLVDLLTEMELRRKGAILERMPRAEPPFAALERLFRELPVEFAWLVAAEKNLRLNRLEVLVCVAKGGEDRVSTALAEPSRKLNIRIDALAITTSEFLSFLTRAEHNPIQEMVADGIALFGPQSFWATIAAAEAEGRHARAAQPVDPVRLSRADLMYNLARFGFPLLGGATRGKAVCIELTVTAALIRREARLHAGAAVVLSKAAFHPRVLAFLSTKHGTDRALRALLTHRATSPRIKDLRDLVRGGKADSPRSSGASLPKTMEAYHAD